MMAAFHFEEVPAGSPRWHAATGTSDGAELRHATERPCPSRRHFIKIKIKVFPVAQKNKQTHGALNASRQRCLVGYFAVI